jgi:hypothetical protein
MVCAGACYDMVQVSVYNELYRTGKDSVHLVPCPKARKKGLVPRNSTAVTKVKRKGGGKNPYAICNASMGGKSRSKTNSKGQTR